MTFHLHLLTTYNWRCRRIYTSIHLFSTLHEKLVSKPLRHGPCLMRSPGRQGGILAEVVENSQRKTLQTQTNMEYFDFRWRIVGVTILWIDEKPLIGIGRLFGTDNSPADNRPKRYWYISIKNHSFSGKILFFVFLIMAQLTYLSQLLFYSYIKCFYLLQSQSIWGPFLIIAPASTLHNWQQEVSRFVPQFKVSKLSPRQNC